jgi:nucleoside-diphosphate-sugar epimerase
VTAAPAPASVLVTGADGYLGRRIVRRYLDTTDLDVLLLVRADGRSELDAKRADLAAAFASHRSRVHLVVGNLAGDAPFAAIAAPVRDRITQIVHGGAITVFNVEQERARRVNVEGTERTLELARACPQLEAVALLSSVYSSGLRTGPIPEEALDGGSGFANFYEWSKWEAEQVVLSRYADLPYRILRVATVIADDGTGRVSRYNAFHQALKLCFYGLLSLLPGDPATPLYFVTADFVSDAVVRLTAGGSPGGIYHLAHAREDAITLGRLLAVAFDVFDTSPDFRQRGVLRPLLADQESFTLLVDGVASFAGSLVTQALENVLPFARQLYVAKEVDNARLRDALPDYRAPNPEDLVTSTCRHLVETRWGRRAVAS